MQARMFAFNRRSSCIQDLLTFLFRLERSNMRASYLRSEFRLTEPQSLIPTFFLSIIDRQVSETLILPLYPIARMLPPYSQIKEFTAPEERMLKACATPDLEFHLFLLHLHVDKSSSSIFSNFSVQVFFVEFWQADFIGISPVRLRAHCSTAVPVAYALS